LRTLNKKWIWECKIVGGPEKSKTDHSAVGWMGNERGGETRVTLSRRTMRKVGRGRHQGLYPNQDKKESANTSYNVP